MTDTRPEWVRIIEARVNQLSCEVAALKAEIYELKKERVEK